MDPKIAIFTPENFPTAMVEGKRILPIMPTAEQVKGIEEKLAIYLKRKKPKLFEKYSSYYRQYTGVTILGGKKIIRGNFMCHVDGEGWKKQWIETEDGGDCYFNFTFDLDKSEISEFYVNGNS